MPNPRDITTASAWCWQEKAALRKITEVFSESGSAASARSVYVALTEIASDNQAEHFQEKVALIAHKAGVSVRTAGGLLQSLEQIGLVKITRQKLSGTKLDAPSIYRVLSLGNGCVAVGNDCSPPCNRPEQTSIAEKVEESTKESTEKSPKKAASLDFPPHLQSDEFKTTWDEWTVYRQQLGGKIKDWQALFQRQLTHQLSALTEPQAIQCLRNTMCNGWRGLFPEKIQPGKPTTPDHSKGW